MDAQLTSIIGLKYGEAYEVINNHESKYDSGKRLAVMIRIEEVRSETVYQDRMMLATECSKCIYTCKGKDKCDLYTEEQT